MELTWAEVTNGRPRGFRRATRTRMPVHLLHPFWHTFEHLGILWVYASL